MIIVALLFYDRKYGAISYHRTKCVPKEGRIYAHKRGR